MAELKHQRNLLGRSQASRWNGTKSANWHQVQTEGPGTNQPLRLTHLVCPGRGSPCHVAEGMASPPSPRQNSS